MPGCGAVLRWGEGAASQARGSFSASLLATRLFGSSPLRTRRRDLKLDFCRAVALPKFVLMNKQLPCWMPLCPESPTLAAHVHPLGWHPAAGARLIRGAASAACAPHGAGFFFYFLTAAD